MTATTPQHLAALADANRIRRAMAEHRRYMRSLPASRSLRFAAELLADPDEIVARMTVGYLLGSIQRVGGGGARQRRLLDAAGLPRAGALRRVGPLEKVRRDDPQLTARQRGVLGEVLLAAARRAKR